MCRDRRTGQSCIFSSSRLVILKPKQNKNSKNKLQKLRAGETTQEFLAFPAAIPCLIPGLCKP